MHAVLQSRPALYGATNTDRRGPLLNPYVEAQTTAIVEGIRLLEVYVTAPLGLYSDIKMMREALDFPEAADLRREENARRRQAHAALTDDHPALALEAIQSLRGQVEALGSISSGESSPLGEAFVRRAGLVLNRAEAKVAGDIRARNAKRLSGIYVIVDPEATRGRSVIEVARAALEGGARAVQLRDKSSDKGPMLSVAETLREMCDEYDALFVMNDHADLAVASEAHVLHVGQTDLPVASAREVLRPHQLIGNSNGGMDEALKSWGDAVDYIAVGAIYSTTTMGKSGRTALGPEMITRVKNAVSQPIVAIGGINRSNIEEVVAAGADSVCVVSAVTYADNPRSATEELASLYDRATSS